ncbi:MAG: type VII toxin-antitoxin system HepT family RNase toxin [Aminivibrio sp.]|jgi:uncharacterized protein YutE (UPF0331/DUF86 family)
MADRDVILSKVAAIQRCLARIAEVTGFDPKSLEDIDKQDIFALNLQRAVQAAIDLAAHGAASENLGIPETAAGNFTLLQKAGIIDSQLTEKMKKMTGFRNIAVYNYEALDIKIMKSILVHRLKDLEDFYSTVLRHFKK